MKTFLAKSIAVWGLVALVSGRAASGAAPPYYKVTDLGTLPGASSSEALALNDRGQVIGVCSTGEQGKAFFWEKGVMRPLPLLPGFSPLSLWPHAINNQNQIVGTAFGPNLDTRRAFLIDKGIIQDLGTPAGEYSEAFGINDRGQVVGKSYAYTVNNKGQRQITLSYTFLWSKAMGFRRLSPRTDDFGESVSGINNTGQVIGASWTLGMEEERVKRAALPPDKQPAPYTGVPTAGFLWQNGHTSNLSPPPSWNSRVVAINDRGEVLGSLTLYPDVADGLTQKSFTEILNARRHSHHVFLWRDGQATDLGEMGTEPEVAALALNNSDDIVGYVRLEHNTGFRAFLWRTGKRYMLTDLISPADGWELDEALGINNHGQIIGVGIHNGLRHAFLLTPR